MKYIASNMPQTSTAEPDIISGILLMTPGDVVKLWKRTHTKHTWTDEEAIASYMAVNYAWEMEIPEAMP